MSETKAIHDSVACTMKRHAFVIRIWQEASTLEWRGQIRHVASGQTTMVHNLYDLLTFIMRWTGAEDDPRRSGLQ